MVDENSSVMSDIENLFGEALVDRLKELKHGEGVIGAGKGAYQSVLQKLATAVSSAEDDYRQALLLGTFLNREDASKVVAALSERKRYGVDIQGIKDLVTAWAAVKDAQGGVRQGIITALTHQDITARGQFNKKGFFGGGSKDKDSPISG